MTRTGRPQKPESRCLICLRRPKKMTEGLCPTCHKLLHLPGEGKELAERMIQYMINNHYVKPTEK
jgi:hypothetical protein